MVSLKHPSVLLTATLLFISPLLYIGAFQDPSTLPRYALLAGIVSTALLIYCYQNFNKNVPVFYTPIFFLVFAYLFLSSVSSLWAVEPSNNLVYIVQLVSLVFLFFIVSQITSVQTIKLFLYTSLFAAGLSALIGILQNVGYNFFDLKGPRMGGTFTYKNHAALYLDLIIPVGFILIIIAPNNILKWLSVAAFSICVIYIITSHTRGSHVALYSVVFLFFVILFIFPDIRIKISQSITQNKAPLLIVLISILLVSFMPGKTDEVLNRPAYSGDKIDTSTRDRLTAYRNSLELIKENPVFGSGYGTFWKAFRPYNNHPNVMLRSDENKVMYRLHSDPLQIIVELGIVGALFFMSIFLGTYVVAVKLLRSDIGITEKLLVVGMLLGLSASLVHSLVDFPFLKPSSAIQIWLYLGLLNGLYAKHFDVFVTVTRTFTKLLFLISSLLITVVSVLFFRFFLVGNYYFKLSEISFANKKCADATKYIDKSVSEFKHDFFSHKMRVNTHINCTRKPIKLYKVLTEELAWDNTNTMALRWRGYLYLNAGKLLQAGRDFKRLSYLLPHRSSGVIGEAYVLLESGKYQQAKERILKYDAEYPNDKDIQQALKKINSDSRTE